MDCSLKKLPPTYLGKMPNISDYTVSPFSEKSFHISSRCSKRNFMLEKEFLVKYYI